MPCGSRGSGHQALKFKDPCCDPLRVATSSLKPRAMTPPEWSCNEATTEDTSTGRLTRAVVGAVRPKPDNGCGGALDGDGHPYRPTPMRASQSTP